MPEIEVRPVVASDIPTLMLLYHHYTTNHVWQMVLHSEHEEGQIINFRRVRLPRPVRVEYPRAPRGLGTDWTQRSGILVALVKGQAIGYVSLMLNKNPRVAWATDLVVDRPLRRQGIGSALILASLEWLASTECNHLVLEMQPKNHPAIQMAQKLGFEFCGYNDLYYPDCEIAIFFRKSF